MGEIFRSVVGIDAIGETVQRFILGILGVAGERAPDRNDIDDPAGGIAQDQRQIVVVELPRGIADHEVATRRPGR